MLTKGKEIDIEGNPDCVVRFDREFVVATYNLDKNNGQKSGTLQLFEDFQVKKTCGFAAGLLDLKLAWNKILACTSDGRLLVTKDIELEREVCVSQSCLSYMSISGNSIYASSLDGFIHTIDLESQSVTSESFNPYEIWYVEANENSLFVPVSIGKLTVKDIRTNSIQAKLQLHDSEISSILIEESIVRCGSFDGSISLTDLRMMQRVNRIEAGGGVWRMLRSSEGLITANMEEGFKYIETSVKSTIETSSLAYGICELSSGMLIGCSFYDSKLIPISLTH